MEFYNFYKEMKDYQLLLTEQQDGREGVGAEQSRTNHKKLLKKEEIRDQLNIAL